MAALASTEDMGWLTPVPAREAAARATLAARAAWVQVLPALAQRGQAPGPLLSALDLAGRGLTSHLGGGVPASWVAARGAIEAGVSAETVGLWAGGLAPALSVEALLGAPTLGAAARPATGLRGAPRPTSPLLRGGVGLSPLSVGAAAAAAGAGLPLGGALGRARTPALCELPARGTRLCPPRAGGEAGHLARGRAGGALGLARHLGGAGQARAHVVPSLPGLGLDEARLVRGAAGRLVDPALIAGKLDAPAGPLTALPIGPLGLLGLGWSSEASLAAYPSFKVARGALLRRPTGGLRAGPAPLAGLPAPLRAPLLPKAGGVRGAPRLRLWGVAAAGSPGVGTPLESGLAPWAASWAFVGPAPAEDLDPAFINTTWTPETNTTRRSDHNSRYLVTWAPLAAPLAGGAALGSGLSGPSPRGGLAPLAVRASLLALNEAGLKNTPGGAGATARLAPLAAPRGGLGAGAGAPAWPALWAFGPGAGAAPAAHSGPQRSATWAAGRSASLLTAGARAASHGALCPELIATGSGHSLTSLIAALDLARLTGPDRGFRPRQGYVPLSSSISASRRLRVTKGISLPSDTPMHIICGSKDVIHSWAIPGLGVKIDCIPGYNSHRRLLLRWRGAYWGQCMEVCGRYHHWMPIMVNVVHPALFADWCLAFLRGLDTQAHGGAVGAAPERLGRLLAGLG